MPDSSVGPEASYRLYPSGMAESEDRENTGSNQAGWRQLQAKLLKNHQVRESMASAGSGQLRRGWAALLGAGLLCRVLLQRTRLAMLHYDSGRARRVLAACRFEAERKQSACQRRVTASLHVVTQCFQSWSSRAIREALVRLHLPAIHQLLLKMGWQTWRRAYSVTRCLREAAELHAYLRTYAKHCHASASARAFTVWRGEAETAARLQESIRFACCCGHRLALARWRGLVDGQAHARLRGQRAIDLVGWVPCQSQRHTQQPLTCAPEALRAFLWRQVVASTSRGLVLPGSASCGMARPPCVHASRAGSARRRLQSMEACHLAATRPPPANHSHRRYFCYSISRIITNMLIHVGHARLLAPRITRLLKAVHMAVWQYADCILLAI